MERARRFASEHRAILLILLGAFIVRVVWLLLAQPTPVSDFHRYRELAADLVDHRQFGYPVRTTFYLPGHPLHVALWTLVSRSEIWLGLSSVVLSTVSVGLVFGIGLHIHTQRRTALFAAGLFAFLPIFVFYSPVLATEHLFVVCMLAAMFLLLNVGAHNGVIVSLVGVFAGAAMLTRGEGVFYIPALVLFLWFGSRIPGIVDRLRLTLLIGLGVALIIGPWYVRNSMVASPDTGLSAGAGINFYFAHNDTGLYGWYPEGSPLEGLNAEEANRLGWQLGFEYIRESPMHLFRDIGFGTVQLLKTPEYALYWSTRGAVPGADAHDPANFFEKDVSGAWLWWAALEIPVLLVLGIASLFAYRSWTRKLMWLILPLIASSWVLRTVIYWAKPRYGYFIQVMLVFIAAIALSAIMASNRTDPTPQPALED